MGELDFSALFSVLVSLVAMAGSLAAILFSARQDKRTRLEAIRQFYEEGDGPGIKPIRQAFMVQASSKEPLNRNTFPQLGALMGFYDKWCTLCMHGYLPIWVFKGNPGYCLAVLYRHSKEYIKERRAEASCDTYNARYAHYLELCAEKVIKKYHF